MKKKAVRTRAKQQRALDTRRLLLEAAVKEFAEHGYAAASTRNVARQSDVPHGLVVYHFGGKEGLWRAVVEDLLAENRARFDERLKELEGKDAITKLRAVQEDIFDFSAARLDFHRIMTHVSSSQSPHLKWVVEEHFRHVYDLRADLIRKAQKAGKYVSGDPYHLQYLLLGAYLMPLLLGPEVSEISGKQVDTPGFRAEHKKVCLSLFFRDKK